MKCARIVLVLLAAFASIANAMPTSEQAKKAEPLVLKLMGECQAALKSGAKTRTEVAESAMALAEKAESEAAKLLLMKGAYNLYVRAGEFEKAVDALKRLQAAIPDIPSDNMANIVKASLRGVPSGECGRLAQILDATGGRTYCIIDLSGGPSSTSYPVSYVSTAPGGTFNTDEYKTTKLVLRRIEPGKFMMCGKYNVTLSRPYYIGVFEVTQMQYELVMGYNPARNKGGTRPVEGISYNMIRGSSDGTQWPSSSAVDSSSFMGRLRARTKLDFDLPTEAQWEYACRAGTTSEYNNGSDKEDDLKSLGRYRDNQSDGRGGHSQHNTTVGSYTPNRWGLYDMYGNVWEWCRDWYGDLSDNLMDPKGSATGDRRVLRGGSWLINARDCSSSFRTGLKPALHWDYGFRLALPLQGLAVNLLAGSALAVRSVSAKEESRKETDARKALYCVIDLSSGPSASSYPVSYVPSASAVPEGTFNTDEYKTTKLALRRIEPGEFIMGGDQKDETHRVKISKPFYIGVFEVTQSQYALVTGNNPSRFKGGMRPVERVSYNMIRGSSDGAQWPLSSAVDSDSFMGRLRACTGLDFDLPTEAQWEYACRAGTKSKYNNGGETEDDLEKVGRCVKRSKHPAVVGSYLPNAWGLYDMHGNMWEWCLDWTGALTFGMDPKGASSGTDRVFRGGGWSNVMASFCTSFFRGRNIPSYRGDNGGFRLALPLQGPAVNLRAGEFDKVKASLRGVSSRECGRLQRVLDNAVPIGVKSAPGSDFEIASIGKYTFSYRLDGRGNAILVGSPCVSPRPEGELVVPDRIDGHTVTMIDNIAFAGCDKMTRIVLPPHLERILYESGRIRAAGAIFWGCYALESIEIAQTNSKYSSENGVLYTKDKKGLVAYPKNRSEIVLARETTVLGSRAFNSCMFKTAKIPQAVESIWYWAFWDCPNLEVVEFPESVKWIGVYDFGSCWKMKKVVFHGDAPATHVRSTAGRENLFSASSEDIVVEVRKGSKGWKAKDSTELPERWPTVGSASRPIRHIP